MIVYSEDHLDLCNCIVCFSVTSKSFYPGECAAQSEAS